MCNLYSSKDLLFSENKSTYSHYCQKSWQQNGVHPKWITAIHRFIMQSHVLFIMFMFCLLDRTTQISVFCFRAVQIWFFECNYLILTTGCSTWHLMANNSRRIWELESLLSTKMAEAIRSSVTAWNWVTVRWPGSYRGYQRRVSLGTGLARVDQRSWVLVLCVRCRSWLQKTDAWVCQHCFRGQIGLHGRRPRRKPLLRLAHKKACKQFAEDNLAKSMNDWNHVLRSDGSKVNVFDSDGVQHVWSRPGEEYQENCVLPTVKHGGVSIMVWGYMSAAGTGELWFIEGNMDSKMYCDILKQKMMPSLQKLFSNITTPNTPPRWQLPCCWRWWSGQACIQT